MISIIVPCKNRLGDLRKCLKSIYDSKKSFEQTFSEEIEIIVADDHSDSGFQEKVLFEFPEVLICSSRGFGPGYARNDAFEFSRGEYVLYTDSDCEVHQDWVMESYKALKKGYLVVQGNPCLFQKKNDYGIQEEKLYTLMFSTYVEGNITQMTDSRNLVLNRNLQELLGTRLFEEKQTKATAESRVFAHKCITKRVKIAYEHNIKVFHKDPDNIEQSCRQKFRHGTGRIMLWKKEQDFNYLYERYFNKPIQYHIDKKYVVMTHACFLNGFFKQYQESDSLYYENFLEWIKNVAATFISEDFFNDELKEVLNDV